ncbi:MAG: serine/threonine-protein kinase, partial [Chloroflexota bacterium]
MSDYRKLIGQKVDDYLIDAYIASGGMADVYRATDASNGKNVALKILYSHYSHNVAVNARFKREAESLILLNHPNIIEVYRSGRVNDSDPYIAMEYMPHGSLMHQIRTMRDQGVSMEPGVVLNILQQIANALALAHENGIIHRDLKPANILVRPDGTPVITDMGIAALRDSSTRLTVENQMIGTPDYMSPEQIRAEHLDGRSDIYSFGIMMYEMLAGRRPFENDTPMLTLHQHLTVEPPSLTTFVANLPTSVVNIVQKCLQKDPADRYQTMEEVESAIGAVLRGETIRPARNNTAIYASLGAAVLILAIIAGVIFANQNSQTEPSAVPIVDGLTNTPVPEILPTVEDEPSEIAADIEPSETPVLVVDSGAEITETEATDESEEEPDVQVITATSSPTAEPTETETPIPPTETPEPTIDEFAGKGNGLPIQFENEDTWIMEGPAEGQMVVSDEESFAGDFSGRLDYDFSAGDSLTARQENIVPSSNASSLTVRVFGDGSANDLSALILDANDEQWVTSFGTVDHSGWQFMTAGLSASDLEPLGDATGQPAQPFTFLAIQLSMGSGSNSEGTIFLDNITFQTPATNTPVATATPVATNTPEATPTSPSPAITLRVLEGFRCDEQEHQRRLNQNVNFKW